MLKGLLLLFFISMSSACASIILMDYTSTPATPLDNSLTSTQEHAQCVIVFLEEILGDDFNKP